MDYKDKDDKWIGFDADMARLVGEKLGVDAVSYTHLDVYKRQGGSNTITEVCDELGSAGASHVDTFKAVSYTHLDVYKRQAQNG